jgi:hypothetical protein
MAYASNNTLLVGRYDADLEREDLRRLGYLGYSGSVNIASLAAVAPDSLAVSWREDSHYWGTVASNVAFWTPPALHRRSLATCCRPLLAADGIGGAVGVAPTPYDSRWPVVGGRTKFQRWDPTGRKIAEKTLPGIGYPVEVRSFAGGLLIVRQQQPGKGRWMEHLDLAGKILAATTNVGTALATDGAERIVEGALSPAGKSLVARFRSGLTGDTTSRRLATAPGGSGFTSFDLALDSGGTGVVAWSLDAPTKGCAIRVLPFATDGSALGEELCAADHGDAVYLAAIGHGEFWLVWHEPADPLGRRSVVARKVRVD